MSIRPAKVAKHTQEILEDIARHKAAQRKRAGDMLAFAKSLIAENMRAKRMSQMDLAVLSGLSTSTVFNVLKGQNMKLTTLSEIADALGFRLRITFEPLEA